MISGLLAALGFVGVVLLSKYELAKRKMPISIFAPMAFLAICFLTGILMLATGQKMILDGAVFSFNYVIAFILLIVIAVLWNIFYFQSLLKEKIQEFDLIIMTEPLITIALAGILFSSERNATVFLLALIAAIALIFAHMHHHKLRIDHYAKELIIAVVLMSIEVMFIRYLLNIFSPITLYFWRTLFVFGVMYAIYRPDFGKVKLKDFAVVSLVGVFAILEMVSRYVGYDNGGIVITTLALLLGPVVVEIVSIYYLKEKASYKSIFAFAVVCICVLIAVFTGVR